MDSAYTGEITWANQSTLHPLGFAMAVVCGVALYSLDRRYAVWPMIILACFVAPAQRLVIGGLDFNLMRLLVLFGGARVIMKHEYRAVRWAGVDWVVLAFAMSRTFIYTVQQASVPAFINQAGQSFDTIGLYFLFRCLIRDWDDLIRTVSGFVVISVPVLIAFAIENRTGRNAFASFGGVPAITTVREGQLRCQGAFSHPIIAGCFWATLLPLAVAQWWRGGSGRTIAAVGGLTMLTLVGLTASSTPVMAVLFGGLGAAMFLVRWWMGYVCAAVASLGVFLHMAMEAPIWHLISRVTIARGNTGYHRYELIDNAIRRVGEWWLIGTPSTAHWFWSATDITNQYILEGVRGGMLSLVLLVAIIWMCFRAVGRMWRACSSSRCRVIMAWALGIALFAHCTNFIAVSYFGQGTFIWYLHLAMIVSIAEHVRYSARPEAAAAPATTVVRRPIRLWADPTMGADGPGVPGARVVSGRP